MYNCKYRDVFRERPRRIPPPLSIEMSLPGIVGILSLYKSASFSPPSPVKLLKYAPGASKIFLGEKCLISALAITAISDFFFFFFLEYRTDYVYTVLKRTENDIFYTMSNLRVFQHNTFFKYRM